MVYEYPFTDKFDCCSLYDREGAEETKVNTKTNILHNNLTFPYWLSTANKYVKYTEAMNPF